MALGDLQPACGNKQVHLSPTDLSTDQAIAGRMSVRTSSILARCPRLRRKVHQALEVPAAWWSANGRFRSPPSRPL